MAAVAATNTAMGKDISESVARTTPPLPPPIPLFNNLHEYFKPVFDEVDNLNKMLDSHIEEEKMIDRGKKRKRKRNDPAIKAADNSSTRLPVLLLVSTLTHSNQTTYTTYTHSYRRMTLK
jgi:hypothetical protein